MDEIKSSMKAEAERSPVSSDRQSKLDDGGDEGISGEPERPASGKNDNHNTNHNPGFLRRLFGFGKKGGNQIREDLADVLAKGGSEDAGFTPEEKTMLNNVLRLQHIRVEDVMTPRAELEAIEIETGLGELLCAFEDTGHSRLPVYSESLDDPRGMVHIRDVVSYITQTARTKRSETSANKKSFTGKLDLRKISLSKPLSEISLLREILFVPPSMFASDLMEKMQAMRIQIALVIDEYGGTDGLVSLEDLVEVVVGDIEDEHDEDEGDLIVESSDGVYLCDARAELEDVVARVGNGFQMGEIAEDVETIGGLIFALIGRVPVRGEVIEAFGYEFRVIDADPRRIKKVELARSQKRKRD